MVVGLEQTKTGVKDRLLMNTKLIFLGLGLLLFVISFWIEGEVFDIQLYDTYYVIGWGSLLKGTGLLFCLTGVVYFLFNRQVSRRQ